MTEKFWNFHTVISELSVLPTLLFTNFILGVITGLGILYGATKRYRKKRKKSWIFWDFTWKITIVSFPESSRVPMSLCEFPWVTMILCESALSVSLCEYLWVSMSLLWSLWVSELPWVSALCSRNFQNVKLRLHGVGIY